MLTAEHPASRPTAASLLNGGESSIFVESFDAPVSPAPVRTMPPSDHLMSLLIHFTCALFMITCVGPGRVEMLEKQIKSKDALIASMQARINEQDAALKQQAAEIARLEQKIKLVLERESNRKDSIEFVGGDDDEDEDDSDDEDVSDDEDDSEEESDSSD